MMPSDSLAAPVHSDRPGAGIQVVCIGDVMLDIIVNTAAGLRADDDVEAKILLRAGGQAANVAVWAANLGAEALVVGPAGGEQASIVAAALAHEAVSYQGLGGGEVGTVVSVVSPGVRSMASDAGQQGWLGALRAEVMPAKTDFLHLSGYPLWRATPTEIDIVADFLADFVAATATQVSLDVAARGLLESVGSVEVVRRLRRISPQRIFANAAEWQWLTSAVSAAELAAVEVVIKRGAEGIVVRQDARATAHPVPSVVTEGDTTGAGDALAAGYLIGGPELGLSTAARCVAMIGAQPEQGTESTTRNTPDNPASTSGTAR